jgi:cyclopropane fatty-acyl-phospholipid synthase-like methyltransferase
MKIIDIANAVLYKAVIFCIKVRIWTQFKFKLTKAYQPDSFNKRSQNKASRECENRFKNINDHLPKHAFSTLDIGCNEGYFVFKMAERGGFCHGIDKGRNEIMVADGLAKINNINNIAFSNNEVDMDFIASLPHYDVVIFMSVFHHIARHNGLQYAEEFMSALSCINSKYLIFETGQPDELNTTWARDLGFMQPNVELWVCDMLKRSGYSKIKVIGRNSGIYSDIDRLLFLAEK